MCVWRRSWSRSRIAVCVVEVEIEIHCDEDPTDCCACGENIFEFVPKLHEAQREEEEEGFDRWFGSEFYSFFETMLDPFGSSESGEGGGGGGGDGGGKQVVD